MKSEQINNFTEVKQKTNADLNGRGPIVSDRDQSQVSSDGQTIINLSFAISMEEIIKSLFHLRIDGNEAYEGDDWDFTNIVGGLSSQITLKSPMIADLKIDYEIVGTQISPFPNPSSVAATLQQDVGQPKDWAENAMVDSVKIEEYEIPYLSFPNIDEIKGRKQVKDTSKMLASLFGIERVQFTNLVLLNDEFGSNGEPVYETNNKDERIRFVGPVYSTGLSDTSGSRPVTNVDCKTEITFYGTGLNILCLIDTSSRDIRATVDGGSESGNLTYTTSTSPLSSRNYAPRHVLSVVKGLTLGWHTVVLRQVSSTFNWYGFEIINEHQQLKISQGKAWSGVTRDQLLSLISKDFKPSSMGSNGGRVVAYLKNGEIGLASKSVGSPLYIVNSNHDEEEIIRRINFREFGINRGDDFSTLSSSTSSRAFALKDGTTNLCGLDLQVLTQQNLDVLCTASGNDWFTFTFVGTGLDVFGAASGNSSDHWSVYIDGVKQGEIFPQGKQEYIKICSGLPYGTHTVKLIKDGTHSVNGGIADFIIYGPKKPELPVGAIELCSYNVLQDFIANTTSGLETISKGVLRKSIMREIIYIGSGWSIGLDVGAAVGGIDIRTSTSGDKFMYSFFGTGLDIRMKPNTNCSNNNTIKIDGVLYTGPASVYGSGVVWTPGTSVLNIQSGSEQKGSGMIIKDLPLGYHTIELTNNTSNIFPLHSLDIITPIHVNDSYIGSLALEDKRNLTPIPRTEDGKIDLSKARAYILYDAINNVIEDSLNMSAVIDRGTGNFNLYFTKPFKGKFVASYCCYDNHWGIINVLEYKPNYANIFIRNSSNGVFLDCRFSMIFFGELEGEE